MKVDLEELKAGLSDLTGNDMIRAASAEKKGNNIMPQPTDVSFQARLASYALDVPMPVITGLPAKEFLNVTNTVFVFLYGGTDEVAISGDSTEGLRSDAPNTETPDTGSGKRSKG